MAGAGFYVADSGGKLATLVNPATDMSNSVVVGPLIARLPTLESNYIEEAGPIGRESLVQTVATSAEALSGSTAYDASFNGSETLVKARRFAVNDVEAETRTSGIIAFKPTGPVNYLTPGGQLDQGNGFWNATTNRDFEIAILDTNIADGVPETGSKDDLGIVVKVGQF